MSIHPKVMECLSIQNSWDVYPSKTHGISIHPKPTECLSIQNPMGCLSIQNSWNVYPSKTHGMSIHPKLMECLSIQNSWNVYPSKTHGMSIHPKLMECLSIQNSWNVYPSNTHGMSIHPTLMECLSIQISGTQHVRSPYDLLVPRQFAPTFRISSGEANMNPCTNCFVAYCVKVPRSHPRRPGGKSFASCAGERASLPSTFDRVMSVT